MVAEKSHQVCTHGKPVLRLDSTILIGLSDPPNVGDPAHLKSVFVLNVTIMVRLSAASIDQGVPGNWQDSNSYSTRSAENGSLKTCAN
jgi:hypothetical protein